MEWTVNGERLVYDSPWVQVALADVECGDLRVPEHHVVRATAQVAGVVALNADQDAVLMLWRHRFITGSWGFEVPAGRIDPGETPAEAADRECLEETGWRIGPSEPLARWHPSQGLIDQTFHAVQATAIEYSGPPVDVHEADRIEWVPFAEVERLLDSDDLVDGFSRVALLTWSRRRAASLRSATSG
jgi:8-oxo-dGTP pyrophosphatase MutT (NUDIX family)